MKPKLNQTGSDLGSAFRRDGFTLIELLVVIAIIGLLASIVLVALNGARVKARDAKRIADFKQFQTALALYYDSNNSTYPCVGLGWATSADANWQTSCLATALKPYLLKLPVDSINNGAVTWGGNLSYAYAAPANGQDYDLITNLEDPNNSLRCGTKNWLYHTGGNVPWCTGGSPLSTPALYADH